MHSNDWPPLYTVKRHARSRHVKFSYSRAHGLEITVPTRFSLRHLPGIIEENKSWILKQKQQYAQLAPITRPLDIQFPAFARRWTLHYFQNEKRPRIKHFSTDGLILSGDIDDLNVCLSKLSDWVRKQAAELLIPYFRGIAAEMGVTFSDVSVRSQSTLWGSCSHDKSIRLNYKLIFLPEALIRHIMIHELCHTRHMNHSDQFWLMVASYDEHWQQHKRAMKRADHYIPVWIK